MRNVLNIIINQSLAKFGMQNGKGKRPMRQCLTVESIAIAQKYYDMMLKRIKQGQDELKDK